MTIQQDNVLECNWRDHPSWTDGFATVGGGAIGLEVGNCEAASCEDGWIYAGVPSREEVHEMLNPSWEEMNEAMEYGESDSYD